MRRATLCVMMGMGLVCAIAQAQNVAEQYLLAAANQDRAAHGLAPVRLDAHLIQAALTHNYEMVRHHNISHQFPGEPDLAARAGAAGAHFSLVSENVAEAPNSAMIHDLWMNSEGHRHNLLDPNVDSVGISVIHDHGEYFAVEDFARTVANLSFDQQEAEVAAMLAKRGINPVTGMAEARETCGMETGYAGPRKPWFVMRYTSADIHQLPEELTARLVSGKYRQAAVGACDPAHRTPFTGYSLAVLLYP